MARFVVPPKKPKDVILLKCYRCGTLYSPECKQKGYLNAENYEPCPECGYDHNSDGQQISLWLYNWLRWWRGTAEENEEDDSGKIQTCIRCGAHIPPHAKRCPGCDRKVRR